MSTYNFEQKVGRLNGSNINCTKTHLKGGSLANQLTGFCMSPGNTVKSFIKLI